MMSALNLGLLGSIVILVLMRINAMDAKTCFVMRAALLLVCTGAFALILEECLRPHDWESTLLHMGLVAWLLSDRRTWN